MEQMEPLPNPYPRTGTLRRFVMRNRAGGCDTRIERRGMYMGFYWAYGHFPHQKKPDHLQGEGPVIFMSALATGDPMRLK